MIRRSSTSNSDPDAKSADLRRFLRKLLLVVPVVFFVAGVNVYVDPGGVFHRGQEKQIAKYLLEGDNVANVYNHDDRQGLRYYVEGLKEKKDILVFGSSRTMVVDSEFFPGERLFNASVTAGTLRDVVVNYELFHEKGLVPRKVVIGIEPYMLNGAFDNKLYLEDAYRRALARLGLPVVESTPFWSRVVDRRYAQLLAPAYFQVSVRNLDKVIALGRPQPCPTKEFEVDTQMARADGSLNYGKARRTRDAAEIRRKAERFTLRNPEELANFRVLDLNLRRMFETFASSLLEEGVEVIFLMAPYHPITYRMMLDNQAFRCVGEAKDYFEAYAAQHHIPVYGSYDAGACGVAENDFYDAVHLSRQALLRVFRAGPRNT